MSPILGPLEPLRQHLTIVSGLRNKPGETPEPHGYIEMTWLTCVKPWDHGVGGLAEEKRIFTAGEPHFLGVLGIIAAHAIDAAYRKRL